MKVLFLIFHGFEEGNGISKKIHYQVKALKELGMSVEICYTKNDSKGRKMRIIDKKVLIDYGRGLKGKILKRIEFNSIAQYIEKQEIKFVYMRSYQNANPFLIRMIKRIRNTGAKIVMEIPTYPYDQEYITFLMKMELLIDKCFRKQLSKHLNGIVTFTDHTQIFGVPTIRISNGIDFDLIKMKTKQNNISSSLNLIGVAEIHYWHGFDRLIKGLVEYYQKDPTYKVYFHIVGDLIGNREKEEILPLIANNSLQEYVIMHGKQDGEKLDELFELADMGVGSLARHRSGITTIKTLKNREYAARGIPFIYSETDHDFDTRAYILKIPANESSVNILSLIEFYNKTKWNPQEIRHSIKMLSWDSQMHKVLNKINILTNENSIIDQ